MRSFNSESSGKLQPKKCGGGGQPYKRGHVVALHARREKVRKAFVDIGVVREFCPSRSGLWPCTVSLFTVLVVSVQCATRAAMYLYGGHGWLFSM